MDFGVRKETEGRKNLCKKWMTTLVGMQRRLSKEET
jgi:hypothetical protein